jgi:hypothetical protein
MFSPNDSAESFLGIGFCKAQCIRQGMAGKLASIKAGQDF